MSRFRILGGGVMGLAAATELQSRGARVHIVAPDPVPGPQACSWWAGGMLAPWCEGETAGPVVTRLGQQAAGWWQRHGAPVTRAGTLVLAPGRDRAELARFARRTAGHAPLDAGGIAALEPDLAGRFDQGLFFEHEAHLAPRTALAALHGRLLANGATFAPPGDPILPGDRLIDCRGLAARDALPDLRGVRGEMLVLRCPALTLARPIRLLHPRFPLYIVPRGDGVFMLGATMIESDRPGPVTLRSMLELMSAAYALHPQMAEAEVLETGSGIRPAFADNLPRLRRIGDTLHLNGLFRHGFLFAPVLATMAADHLLNGTHPELLQEETT